MNTLLAVIVSFMAGYLIGIVVKGNIDDRYERIVQESLIRVGQQADDEIEALEKKVEKLEAKIREMEGDKL